MTDIPKREINIWWALIPLVVMIVAMVLTIVVFQGEPHVPLIIGTGTAALVAWKQGYTWKQMEEMMFRGIRLALPAIIIIMLVGLTIGAWIGGGIVATMIYYGLKIISPSIFLVTITIICGVVALTVGSSWATMGTIGVAGMGIGMSMGIPAPMVAGAVISGSYFGDKMSPLSDTTNLASGLTNTDLFVHIKHMLYTTVPSLIIALLVFAYIGKDFGKDAIENERIAQTIADMQANFVISPYLLLIPLLVIVLVMFKVPAVPAIATGIVMGFFSQIFIQGDASSYALQVLQNGYTINTNNEMVSELFNRGGLMSMMYTVSMTIVAMAFGGIMEYSGMLKAMMDQLLKVVKSTGNLIASTLGAAFLTNATCSEQYISIVVPARMFATVYKKKGLHSKNLSRSLEDGGTLTSVFIPWNTCGVFIYTTLEVHAFSYAPYAMLNFTVPIVALIYAYTGFTITKIEKPSLVLHSEKAKDASG
ncbi:Na+/H+ antiporter NhaC [Virgibacillus pantothenticus]|uniref:Na+/H+ antiporter NhaC n=1 Tax=Virgibacillus TaxID=84406 RepID=UPI00090AE873|nr:MULTISPECIES: Na+/H+ antiporter NhaC [Virgibacillus]API91199.1 Na+/H+ antiporter NhaC [Virgibacillus sp. 6R]MBS7429193.1 Na+/H+ antiporter NhaC [Virgibacillus sp. 19R1-5]MBU8567985.1 Na+/H+ antiporter NhaC [Virgibacillus pantothenticus]MBU8601758.1 Na+/H+ antiporter NhaC [Virgibacillus pantothenticus]MBU8636132.1 Na+/H+ antiporter NhaC [Virgibacillus pantothenticus]